MCAAVDLALEHLCDGEIAQAEALCLQFLDNSAADPHLGHADAMQVLSMIAHARGDAREALVRMRQAVALDPLDCQRRLDLARIAAEAGAHYEAAAHLETVVSGCGELPEALLGLGRALLAVNQPEFAIDRLTRAVSAAPELPEHWFELGRAYAAAGRFNDAVYAFEGAQKNAPADAEIALHLGKALHAAGRISEAVSLLGKVVTQGSQGAAAFLALGSAELSRGHVDEAHAHHQAAVRLSPLSSTAHRTLAETELSTGRFDSAWRHLWESERLATQATAPPVVGPDNNQFSPPVVPWYGDYVPSATLIITLPESEAETWFLLRYIEMAKTRVGRISWAASTSAPSESERALGPFLKQNFERQSEAPPANTNTFHYQASLASLPAIFDAGPPRGVHPYLDAAPNLVARYRGRCRSPRSQDGRPLRVGLVWESAESASLTKRAGSAVHLSRYLPILGTDGVHCVSLQRGLAASQIEHLPPAFPMQDAGLFLNESQQPLQEIAALISTLDLVITVDGPTAHLAGALGVATWVMVPHSPSPLWGTTKRKLYATTDVFQAGPRNDFGRVVMDMRKALKQAVDEHREAQSSPRMNSRCS